MREVIAGVFDAVQKWIEPTIAGLENRIEAVESKGATPGPGISAGEGPPLSAGQAGDLYLDVMTGDLFKWAA